MACAPRTYCKRVREALPLIETFFGGGGGAAELIYFASIFKPWKTLNKARDAFPARAEVSTTHHTSRICWVFF